MMNDHQSIHTKPTLLHSLLCVEKIAHNSLVHLPKIIAKQIQGISIKSENFASDDMLKSLNLDDKYKLLGLYCGTPIHAQHSKKTNIQNNTFYLFRGPILRYARDYNEAIEQVIKDVLIEEIGYHLGLSRRQQKNPSH